MKTCVMTSVLPLLAAACHGNVLTDAPPITWTSSGPAGVAGSNAEQAYVSERSGLGMGAGLAAASGPTLELVSNTYVGQITSSPTNPFDGLGMIGTDLGISYERGGKLFFLFGDSWTTSGERPSANKDLDSVAWADAASPLPDGVPVLNWIRRGEDQTTGEFLPLRVNHTPAIPSGPMSVPVEGVPYGRDTYIFFYVTYNNGSTSSVLAHAADDDFTQLEFDHEAKNSKLQSVSTLTVGDELWIYGAGKYRNSPVYLARAELASLADRSSWRYYNAPDTYLTGESNAKPLPLAGSDSEKCVGEISVRKHPSQELYFMAYNCDKTLNADRPHDIRLRVARHPEGPWSAPLTILDVGDGDHKFVHKAPQRDEADDGLGEPTRKGDGDMYGPYLIPAWFSDPAPGEVEIVYTLSSWNPYQVQLLRTRVRVSEVEDL